MNSQKGIGKVMAIWMYLIDCAYASIIDLVITNVALKIIFCFMFKNLLFMAYNLILLFIPAPLQSFAFEFHAKLKAFYGIHSFTCV